MNISNHKRAVAVAAEDESRVEKARLELYGREMIEKVVKSGGPSGRVYLPPGWIGKTVKIIRVD